MEKGDVAVSKEEKFVLSLAEFTLTIVVLFFNYDLLISIYREHCHLHVSNETAFLVVIVALGVLHFTEPRRARHGNLYFRQVPRQGLVLGTVLAFSICMQHFKIYQKILSIEHDPATILTIYKNYAISMGLATLFYGILYLLNIDIAFVAPVVMLSLGLLQDHFSDINFIIPLGAVLLYSIIFLGLIKLCPRSFTIAEGVMISQGATFMMTDLSLLLVVKLGYKSFLYGYSCEVLEKRTYESMALSTLLTSTIIISICLSPVFYYLAWYAKTRNDNLIYSAAFYIGGIMNTFAVFIPVTYIVLGVSPVWYITSMINPSVAILIVWWIFLLLITCCVIIWKTDSSNKVNGEHVPNIVIRKFFHLIAILIFLPGIYFEPNFTALASGIAIVVLIVCEYFRIFKIYPFGEILDRYLVTFVDERDSGTVILTHIYLLFGFALPVWLFPFNRRLSPCAFLPYSGVISLGIGDSFASLIGKRYGKLKIAGSSKTYVGMFACVISQFAAFLFLMVFITGYVSMLSTMKILFAVCLTAFMESVTSQIDNLVLSPLLYTTLSFLFDT